MPRKTRIPSCQLPATRPPAVVAVGGSAANTGVPTATASRHRPKAKAKCRHRAEICFIDMISLRRCLPSSHTRFKLTRARISRGWERRKTEDTRHGYLAGAKERTHKGRLKDDAKTT